MDHTCRVIATPWSGVFATVVDSSRHYERHWHATFGMGFMERGGHRSMSGRGIVDARAGDVITTNPGEVHDGRPLGTPSRRWRMVYMEPAVMASMVSGIVQCRLELTRPVVSDRPLLAALQRLFQQLDQWNAGGQPLEGALASEEAFVVACGLALRRHATVQSDDNARADIRRARERLADDMSHPPTLAELAGLVGLSKYQLLRYFERTYGLTPFEWLRQARVERARGSIRAGISLAQVAAECGFADQSHMTRAFVAHFGFTPGAWSSAVARRRGGAR